jgi:RNA polymerase sigma factor (sigma-70 family)
MGISIGVTPVLGQRLRAERAFERLYQRHVGDVYRYSLAILRNPSDAEDVTQTTFLNAYRAYRSGERPDSPRAWLIAIAHNVCRQRFRTASRRPQEVAYEDTVAEASVPDPEAPTAEEIQRALGQLAFNQRAALVMRELEGRSYAEIAELLDVSTSAVETLLFRARRALREQLEGSISCAEAEVAISKQLDRKLSRAERGSLRAHLRECADCASLARKQRAQRSAIRGLAVLPLPSSLAVWGGGTAATGTAIGGSVALKAAAVVAAGTVAVGVGREAATRIPEVSDRAEPTAASAEPRADVARPALGAVVDRTASLRAADRRTGPTAARPVATAKAKSTGRATSAPPAQAASYVRAGPKPKATKPTKPTRSRAVGAKAEVSPARVQASPRQGAAVAARTKPKQKADATHAKATKRKVVAAKRPTAKPAKAKPPSSSGGNKGGGGKG